MPDIREPIVQPVGSPYNFPFSWAVVGSMIPGLPRRYPVKTVNHPDGHQEFRHVKPVDPVKKFPEMESQHAKNHPITKIISDMMQKRGAAIMIPGYERVKEDLSWRGASAPTPMQSGAPIFGV